MTLGIGSYTFGWAVGGEPPWAMDENGLLDTARDQGVRLVQIGDNIPLARFDDARLDHLGARAAREGVTLEVGARGLTPANLETHIRIARRLRAPLLRFVIDAADYRPLPEQVTAMLREAVSELGDGPTVAIENHDRLMARMLRAIIEEVGDERVGICLDTANSYGAGEGWREVSDTLAPYTVGLHVKDFTVERLPHQMGFTLTGRPAGEGLLDLPWLLGRLAPYGRCRSAVLELWTPAEESPERTLAQERAWASRSLQYLRPFFSD